MKVDIKRCAINPIVTTHDVKPTFPNYHVDCAFNAGVTKFNDEVILLLRVAESVIPSKDTEICVPVLEKNENSEYKLVNKNFDKNDDKYDFSDSRVIRINKEDDNRVIYLTSLSHIRIARSKDGENFTTEDTPFIFPEGKYEAWGIEDPRVTKIEDTYYINYTAVSEYGCATALAKTKDFITYERMGVIFPPENKDVSIFPEKIDGMYYAYHRPVPEGIGNPDMWIAKSPDLIHWGGHEHLIGVANNDSWENGRIGGGAPSFKTEKGWVHIYHAADREHRYCLGAFITDLNDPSKIIAKTDFPILEPVEDYEVNGFFGKVVFTCGLIVEDDIVKIYYGAADEVMALAEISVQEIFKCLGL